MSDSPFDLEGFLVDLEDVFKVCFGSDTNGMDNLAASGGQIAFHQLQLTEYLESGVFPHPPS
jgi:hypothetical protein